MPRIFSSPVRYNNASNRNHIAVGASKLLRIYLSRDQINDRVDGNSSMPHMIIKAKQKINRMVLSLVALMGLLIVAACGYYRYDVLLKRTNDDFGSRSIRIGNDILSSIETLREDIGFLSRAPFIFTIAQSGSEPAFEGSHDTEGIGHLQKMLSAFAETRPMYRQIRYISLAGNGQERVRVEYRDDQVVVVDHEQLGTVGDQDYFRETVKLHNREVYLSRMDFDQIASMPVLHAATPIFTESGKLAGIVVIDMRIGEILNRIGQSLPPHVQAFVADSQGRYIVRPDQQGSLGFKFGKSNSFMQDFPDLAPDAVSHHSLQKTGSRYGKVYISTHRLDLDPSLPDRFLLLSYVIPKQAVLWELAVYSGLPILVMALIVAFAGMLFQLWLSRIFVPLENITKAAQAMATGGRDIQLPHVGLGPVSTLTHAFRHMLEKIQERENDYIDSNKALEERMRAAELQLAANVVENTSEGILIVDHETRIIAVNPAFVQITGYTAQEAIGQKPSLLRSNHHDADFYRRMWQELLSTGHWQGELWNRRKGGEAYLEWLSINVIPGSKDQPDRYVGIFNDITELRRKDERNHYLAFHDPLTGLPNRALLQDRLRHAVSMAERSGTRLAVMFIDLNRFKAINDTLGHDMGDQLLQRIAQRFKALLRHSDTVARMGGDEFVVLLEQQTLPEDCIDRANTLINALAEPIEVRGVAMQVGISIGIAVFPEDGATDFELMKHADAAMYAAKAEGVSAYRFFSRR